MIDQIMRDLGLLLLGWFRRANIEFLINLNRVTIDDHTAKLFTPLDGPVGFP
ncbi:hypothetical protein D3C87_1623670 [compost metagenome]